jgi:hypothetical protein
MGKRDDLASICRTINRTLPLPLATTTARTSPTFQLIVLVDELMSA